MELYGEKNLSNAELLAIIIKTGTKEETSVEIAKKILNLNQNIDKEDLNFLRDISQEEFMQINGIGRVKAIQLKAMCELAIRMNRPTNYKKIQISKPIDIAKTLMEDLRYLKQEEVRLIILNNKNFILKILKISIGSTNFVNIKDILSEAIKMKAPKIILVHNHPSGDSTPSRQDINITKKIDELSKILGIELLDHIVIGNGEFTSIKTIEKSIEEL